MHVHRTRRDDLDEAFVTGASTRSQLAALTTAKVVSNTALRWVGPFLPTLERAFSTTTGAMTGVMGVCELAGLSTVATGPALDRGHERRVFALGLVAVAISSAIALGGELWTFAVSYAVLLIGVSNLTAAGHAWIGHRIPFTARGRAIGAFETSWAVALLLGAPVLAMVITTVGWRGPYMLLAAGALIAAWVVTTRVAPGRAADAAHPAGGPLPRSAWAPMIASAATAAAGLGTFVVSGTWLDDAHGLSTGGLGIVAAGFGLVELVASSSVAAFGDRIGARRSVLTGLTLLGAGLALMHASGSSRPLAIAGLLVFLAGFEFGFVSSLTLVTEAAPQARGRAIGISNAMGTTARATAVFTSGQLYEAFGIGGTITLAAVAAGLAMAAALATSVAS